MSIAEYPSKLVLPQVATPYPTLLEYLCRRFNKIAPDVWRQRFIDGKVLDEHHHPLEADCLYLPQQTIFYFREIIDEVVIPFQEEVIYRDDHLLVACKPHFLPVTPGGRFVKQCLVYRLRAATGNDNIVPLHRIDRHTAGLVMFSTNPQTRSAYAGLFSKRLIEKTYAAVAYYNGKEQSPHSWRVENRIGRSDPWFLRQIVPGVVNASSTVKLDHVVGDVARFTLYPHTGKTHQLRIHMSSLGFPIVNDRCYPQLLEEQQDDYSKPLQLLAKQLRFTDPITGKQHFFTSERRLFSNLVINLPR